MPITTKTVHLHTVVHEISYKAKQEVTCSWSIMEMEEKNAGIE